MTDMITIDKLTAYSLNIPLSRPFRISVGEIVTKELVLFEGRCKDIVGWGEAAVDGVPFYTPETVGSVMAVSRTVLGALIKSRKWSHPTEFVDAFSACRGHHFAKAALEGLLWDLYGKLTGKSVATLLGGGRKWVECGPSIGIKEIPEELVESVSNELSKGWRRIKIKVSPGKDSAFIEAVRKAFPDITLMVDANSAYKPSDMERLVAWDEYDLLMIEQPFDRNDLYYHAELCERMKTPICLDESIETPHLADCAVKMKAADIINIKVGRVGGLVNTIRVHDVCRAAAIPVWIGSRIGTGVADAMRIAAASLPNATFPSGAGCGRDYLEDDIVKDFCEMRNGCEYRVPTGPGVGVDVDRKKLEKYTVGTEEL